MFNELLTGTAIGIGAAIALLFLIALIVRLSQNKEKELLPETEPARAEAAEKSKAGFSITRREIADDARRIGDPGISVIERPSQPQLPMSLKHRDKTYAMLHGTENGVMMIVRIADQYAGELAKIHPEICRARFPRGANWYCVPIGGVFKDKESVYQVLDAARGFVAQKSAARSAVKPAAQKAAALRAGNTAETGIAPKPAEREQAPVPRLTLTGADGVKRTVAVTARR